MTMTIWEVGIASAVGLGLGFFYFSTLWLTVGSLSERRHPALWTLVSFVFRMAVLLVVFVAFTGGDVLSMVSLLVGFMVARGLLIRRWGGSVRDELRS
jgi:F1F0 ATPase subunit 2